MFSFIKTLLAVSAIAAILPTSLAQGGIGNQTEALAQQRRLSACQNSIRTPGFYLQYEFEVSDTTQFNMTYNYDYSLCQGITVQSARLANYGTDGSFVACTFEQFTTAETFNAVCARTNGDLARAAGPDGQDFSTELRFGIRPTYYVREDIFNVVQREAQTTTVSSTSATATATSPATTTTPPATSSEVSRRRRRALSNGELVLDSSMVCDAGHSSCPMQDRRKRWFNRCIDTSSELYACGGCPGSAETQDCSELKGVADVRCVAGTCQIKQCDRSHKLSSDGKTCVRKESNVKRSLW